MLKYLLKILPISLIDAHRKRFTSKSQILHNLMLHSDPELFEILSQKYALYMFNRCKKRIPAYKEFLKKSKFKKFPTNIKDFVKIPETNKKNYIFSAKKYSDLCLDGNIKNVNFWVKSSGHSGKEREWSKNNQEIKLSSVFLKAGLDILFNTSKRSTLIINGYILGSWVTGISFALMAHENNAIVNVGPLEKEILELITTLGKEYDQIIILGYPPFIKHLVDYGCSIKFKWSNSKINFFAGGEYFPEEWRDYVKKKANILDGKIISGYGSSDLGIVWGGIETNETITLRKLAKNNKKLSKDLFGETSRNPMIFQYPPIVHIHANKKKELHFTTLTPESVMPLINYNLKDIGGVIKHNEMKEILKKHNINLDLKMKLPFLFVEGRSTGAVKLCAFMIYPENIKECIYRVKEIANTTTGKFKLKTKYDKKENEQFFIEFELAKNIKISKKLTKTYSDNIAKILREINGGYDSICENIPESSFINVVLYKFGEFPYNSKIKNKYT